MSYCNDCNHYNSKHLSGFCFHWGCRIGDAVQYVLDGKCRGFEPLPQSSTNLYDGTVTDLTKHGITREDFVGTKEGLIKELKALADDSQPLRSEWASIAKAMAKYEYPGDDEVMKSGTTAIRFCDKLAGDPVLIDEEAITLGKMRPDGKPETVTRNVIKKDKPSDRVDISKWPNGGITYTRAARDFMARRGIEPLEIGDLDSIPEKGKTLCKDCEDLEDDRELPYYCFWKMGTYEAMVKLSAWGYSGMVTKEQCLDCYDKLCTPLDSVCVAGERQILVEFEPDSNPDKLTFTGVSKAVQCDDENNNAKLMSPQELFERRCNLMKEANKRLQDHQESVSKGVMTPNEWSPIEDLYERIIATNRNPIRDMEKHGLGGFSCRHELVPLLPYPPEIQDDMIFRFVADLYRALGGDPGDLEFVGFPKGRGELRNKKGTLVSRRRENPYTGILSWTITDPAAFVKLQECGTCEDECEETTQCSGEAKGLTFGVKQEKSQPQVKNNDGRETCFDCGAPTRPFGATDGGRGLGRVCTKCEK